MGKEIISGVYKILNLVNDKFYIGSSKNIYERWDSHKKELRHNCHYNGHLQNAWNKYGEDNFQFIILEKCEPEQRLEREDWYIKNTKCYLSEIGYNVQSSAIPEYIHKDDNCNTGKYYRSGERAASATLTDEQALQIINMYNNGDDYKYIADKFEIPVKRVLYILRGDTWKHLSKYITRPAPGKSGVANGRAKLKEEDVINIIREFNSGAISKSELARKYKVSSTTITNIIKGKLWSYIDRSNIL